LYQASMRLSEGVHASLLLTPFSWNSDIRIEKNVNVFKKNRVVEIFVYLLTVPSEAASKGITGT